MKRDFPICFFAIFLLFGSCYLFEDKVDENKIDEGPEYGTFTDSRDGDVYKTVKIGNQTWFAENLRFTGNIPQVTSQQAWAAIYTDGNQTGQPAWSYYDNDPNNNAVYGKLYNWYAVNTGTLCPQGWHIPTDAEWTTLTNFLGGSVEAGVKIKSVTGWTDPNKAGTNESGFTGLPGGGRHVYGGFNGLGNDGTWWSSTPEGTNDAWRWSVDSYYGFAIRYFNSMAYGFSCRCLRD
jgi:uncharacterized protein (TIGR02145 family)